MSSTNLNQEVLQRLQEGIMESMKTSGAFDELRVSLVESYCKSEKYKQVIEFYKKECEDFCSRVNLSDNRNSLRIKLGKITSSQDRYSGTGHRVKNQIKRFLEEQDKEIQAKYNALGAKYLEKFVPKSSPSPPAPSMHSEEVMSDEVKSESYDQAVIDMVTSPLSDDLDIERPTYSPLGNETPPEQITPDEKIIPGEQIMREEEMVAVKEEPLDESEPLNMKIEEHIPLHEVPLPAGAPPLPEISLDEVPLPDDVPPMDVGSEEIAHREVKLEHIPQPPDEDSESLLTFSEVSSICTADMTDYDYSIKLSDDELSIIGGRKNPIMPVEELKGRIYDLESKDDKIKQELPETTEESAPVTSERNTTTMTTNIVEPHETSESDGGCSETTAGRRVARTRKSNPRYSNEHYKLL